MNVVDHPAFADPCEQILDRIGKTHRFYNVLRCLCTRHPETVDRNTLLHMGSFQALGPIAGPAAFEFWLIQVDSALKRLGWRIAEHNETYRLTQRGSSHGE